MPKLDNDRLMGARGVHTLEEVTSSFILHLHLHLSLIHLHLHLSLLHLHLTHLTPRCSPTSPPGGRAGSSTTSTS